MGKLPFTVEHTSRNISNVRFNFHPKSQRKEQWFLLRSDAHHDNPKCDQALEKKHLEQAVERDAGILDFGDLFCAMQGKYDKRSNKSAIRPEHQNGEYLDSLVETAADFYEPYAKNWIVLGKGNHETSIKDRHETDLTERLAKELNTRTGSNILPGGYTGWVKFSSTRQKQRTSRTLWHTHGYGGGGPVTEDMIQTKRQQVYVEGADIMCSGHVHRSWMVEFVKHKLNHMNNLEKRTGIYVKLPTYKDAYGDGHDNWEVRKGMGPRPLGAYWLKFWWERHTFLFSVEKAM